MARKIIVHIAVSADGFIARKDGSYDWLDRPRPRGNYGLDAFFRSIDTILWGRKTYDQAVEKVGGVSGFGPDVKNYVFTHHIPEPRPQDVEFVNEPVKKFARRLRARRGKDIWIMGGGGIIASSRRWRSRRIRHLRDPGVHRRRNSPDRARAPHREAQAARDETIFRRRGATSLRTSVNLSRCAESDGSSFGITGAEAGSTTSWSG